MTSFKDYKYEIKGYGRGSVSKHYIENRLGSDLEYIDEGDTFQIKKYTSIESKHFKNYDQIFVLTSSANASASDEFIKFCNKTNYAITIGKKTAGGTGISINPMYIELPNTHFLLRFDAVKSNSYKESPQITNYFDDLDSIVEIISKQ